MIKYICLEINKTSRYDLDVIVDHLQTSLDEDPTVDYLGNVWLHIKTPEDMLKEAFLLGNVYNTLERVMDIEEPFKLSYHELDNPVESVVLK